MVNIFQLPNNIIIVQEFVSKLRYWGCLLSYFGIFFVKSCIFRNIVIRFLRNSSTPF